MCPTDSEKISDVKEIVKKVVEGFRPTVPLIKMKWKNNLKTWADK